MRLLWRQIISVTLGLAALAFAPLGSQTPSPFDDFLLGFGNSPAEEQPVLIDRFVAAQRLRGGFPIASANGQVVFVYAATGQERDVRLAGDFAPRSYLDVYWDPKGQAMDRMGRC